MVETSLDNELVVTVNGEERVILMSFGLKNSVCKLIGSFENISSLLSDFELRSNVLHEIFVPRDKAGRPKADFDVNKLDLSDEDFRKTMRWVMDHVYDFFLSLIESLSQTHEKFKERAEAQQRLLIGGED